MTHRFPIKKPPARAARPRLLIVGCGSVGLRVARQLAGRARVFALTRDPGRLPELRAAGCVPLLGDLDRPATLRRLRGLAARVLMLAPPPAQGADDPRSAHLAAALRRPAAIVAKRGTPPARELRTLVYASTTGVYGDARGARIAETRPVRPATGRARRRVAAETLWRGIAPARARRSRLGLPAWRTSVLRIPGIYGRDRLPLARLERALPCLPPGDDVYTNHIEEDDLARALVAALWRGRPQRVVHAADGQDLKMGDYLDQVADALALPRPPRLAAERVRAEVGPAMWSFMQESRRLDNRRLLKELRVEPRHPSVAHALRAWFTS